MHPKDEDTYPVDTVVRIKKTGEFAIIRQVCFQFMGRNFLNYLGEIEGRKPGLYALYHSDIELEALPNESEIGDNAD
jgi:hypothetical protein